MTDRAFAMRFLGPDDGHDPDEFWKKEIGYGRIGKRLRSSLVTLNVPADQIDNYLSEQLNTKAELSGAVHAAMRSAFRSLLIPSLIYEGRYSTEFLGHHSALTPFLVYWVGDRTHAFGEIVVTFLMKESAVEPLAFLLEDRRKASPFFAAFFVLQNILIELEPDLQARYQRMVDRRDSAER
jgi:hypothetical protein